MQLLVSVKDPAEALLAAAHGAHFIDAKAPGEGALGGLPPATIAAIVRALRGAGHAQPVSATIGDWGMEQRDAIVERVHAVAATGADIVKVGILRDPAAFAVLDALAATGHALVPVFIADRGLDFDLVGHAATRGFAGLMVDTADKLAGSLFDVLPRAEVQRFVARTRAAGLRAGIAGALRQQHEADIRAVAPDFAGFRSAVCAGSRADALDPSLLRALVAALAADQPRAMRV